MDNKKLKAYAKFERYYNQIDRLTFVLILANYLCPESLVFSDPALFMKILKKIVFVYYSETCGYEFYDYDDNVLSIYESTNINDSIFKSCEKILRKKKIKFLLNEK